MERDIKLIWDFRGPDSQKIATHHQKHLEEFIEQNNIEEHRITGVEIIDDMHTLAYWVIPESKIMLYRDVLKPHRATLYTKA